MTTRNPTARRRAKAFARAGAIGSAIMLTFTTWAVLTASATGTNAGNAQVVDPNTGQPLSSGGSSTNFTLKLPQGAACTGDSATGQYKVQSYMVPSSVDPGSLQYGSSGPQPTATGANFREPLFDTNGTPYVNAQTANATTAGGPGPIINIPTFNFAVYAPGDIPPGNYNLGIACTKGPASTTQLDKYWNVQLTFTSDPNDSPAQIHWAASASPTTTTTAAPSGTTTTATPGSTTTTAPATTTTTTQSGTTTTTNPGSTGSTSTTSASTPGSTTTTVATRSTTTTTPSGSTSTTTSAASGTVTDASGHVIAPNSTLTAGQNITMSGEGFSPGETVNLDVHSATVNLAITVADSTGGATASGIIPSGLDPGPHTLTLTGVTRTVTFPFVLAASSSGTGAASSGGTSSTSGSSSPLALTGSSPWTLVLWAVLLIGFGRVAVVLGRLDRSEWRR